MCMCSCCYTRESVKKNVLTSIQALTLIVKNDVMPELQAVVTSIN